MVRSVLSIFLSIFIIPVNILTSIFMSGPSRTRVVVGKFGAGVLQEGFERICAVGTKIDKDITRFRCTVPSQCRVAGCQEQEYGRKEYSDADAFHGGEV